MSLIYFIQLILFMIIYLLISLSLLCLLILLLFIFVFIFFLLGSKLKRLIEDTDGTSLSTNVKSELIILEEMNGDVISYLLGVIFPSIIIISESSLKINMNTALGIVHQCGTFVHCMRAKSPPSAKIIVQLYNLLYTYFMYEFSYK